MTREPIVLTDEEAAELYRFTKDSYISPSAYPALSRLLDRVGKHQSRQGEGTCRT